ncbi:MAG: 3-oxoacyl-[acyl-carrier-protein] synthase III C-terminal domain-containing protein [Dehalococcoidia bacterium]|nr:3-oxoacyl-[acyl-carrier-protein] synthase III C-terminal domain-containing protein [Dehalococcoidia bacterium]
MAGIVSFGGYIPLTRMDRAVIGQAWGTGAMPGEKAVANYDEDSVTMSVAACLDCIGDMDRQKIDGVFVATTTSPYQEKQIAAIIAKAIDLRSDALTADYTGSLRGSTLALKAAMDAVENGPAKQILVVAADCRIGAAQGQRELAFGDGAAAVMVGKSGVIAKPLCAHSVYSEMLDVWRTDEDHFVKAWEDRFIIDKGYMIAMTAAIGKVMKDCQLMPNQIAKAVLYNPDARSAQGLAKAIKLDPKTQLQDSFFKQTGNTGAAQTLITLVAALETAKSGDKMLVVSYGDGADAFVFEVTEEIANNKGKGGVTKYLGTKKMVKNYEAYAKMRGLIQMEGGSRPPETRPSAVILWRTSKQELALYGSQCKKCGKRQFPVQRVCAYCQAKDDYDPCRFSDKKGTLVTYTMDNMGMKATDVPPVIASVINFEGGGRHWGQMTDCDVTKIQIGMPLVMTFRKMYQVDGVPVYSWKTKPAS